VPRYKLTIAYEGTNFCGWQKQFPHEDSVPSAPRMTEEADMAHKHVGTSHIHSEEMPPERGSDVPCAHVPMCHVPDFPVPCADVTDRPRVELRTVQSVVERAVRYVVREPIVIHGASRTDSGVHAKGQVAAFTCSDTGGREGGWPVSRGLDTLCRAINARLPEDVLVVKAELVADDFNPIGDCESKGYSYSLWTGRDRPLWERRRVLHIWQDLNADAMADAASTFEGEHDFAAFAAAGHGRATTIRTVFSCQVRRESADLIVMDISGNGFLWNMVRIIVGTLVEVGKGKMTPADIREALTTGDRRRAWPTLPANGLCLEWIRYE
jgi:tRNA pseudouridine38-40 synthase